jgi:hexosaminidase
MTSAFPLVPWPTSVEPGEGVLDLSRVTVVSADPERWTPLAAELLAPLGVTVSPAASAHASALPDDDGGVVIELRPTAVEPAGSTPSLTGDESYELTVGADAVTVAAPHPAGLLHGLRPLRQLVGPDLTAPRVIVRDAPRFGWRSLMFDIARHWFGPAVLRRVVDLAGAYKLNVVHLHLTDDQGWRIEVPSRPALAQISGRTQSNVVHRDGLVAQGERGYLTVDEFRELQEYAAARFVTIVPEIDMPGHTFAATHACGELTPDGKPTPQEGSMEVGRSRLWLDNPATEPWIRAVLGDVAAATIGPYLHVGGDECLTLEEPEYSQLVQIALDVAREHGKIPVAWQEAASADPGEGSILQYWDPRLAPEPYLRAAESGTTFIVTPASAAYLDMKPEAGHPIGQDWIGHDVDLRTSYDWEPTATVPGLPAEAGVGACAALWTETIATQDGAFSMLLPRVPAVAEVAWTPPADRDWESFRTRIVAHPRTWDAHGWAWYASKDASWA